MQIQISSVKVELHIYCTLVLQPERWCQFWNVQLLHCYQSHQFPEINAKVQCGFEALIRDSWSDIGLPNASNPIRPEWAPYTHAQTQSWSALHPESWRSLENFSFVWKQWGPLILSIPVVQQETPFLERKWLFYKIERCEKKVSSFVSTKNKVFIVVLPCLSQVSRSWQ